MQGMTKRERQVTDLQQIQEILDRWRTQGTGSVPAMAVPGRQTDYSKTTQLRQHPASALQQGSRDQQEAIV